MFIVGIFSWWYSKGFISRIQIIKVRLTRLSDYFSIGLLIKTLFAPFRQISADETGVSISDKTKVFFDKLLSRIIGALVRSFMILIGLIAILLQILLGLFILIFWFIIPFLPIIGLILMIIGWVPNNG